MSSQDDEGYAYAEEEYVYDETESVTSFSTSPREALLSSSWVSVGDGAYRPILPEETGLEIASTIHRFASILSVSDDRAMTLLVARRWNVDMAVEAYTGDCDAFLKESGCFDMGKERLLRFETPAEEPTCPICVCEQPEFLRLGCGHEACVDCWKRNLEIRLTTGGQLGFVSPCINGCGEVVPPSVARSLLEGDPLLPKYTHFVQRFFLSSSRDIVVCPQPDCDRAYRVRGLVPSIPCTCSTQICGIPGCSSHSHPPMSCQMAKAWAEKCAGESETANWILSKTKPCPGAKRADGSIKPCGVRIEKNDGCNHMTCKAPGCNAHWCWVCGGQWQDHGSGGGGPYNCNRYKEPDLAAERAGQNYNRYLFYYTRYMNHDDSRRSAKRLIEAMSLRRDAAATRGIDLVDSTYLREALDVLLTCRATLRNTYAMGYFFIAPSTPSAAKTKTGRGGAGGGGAGGGGGSRLPPGYISISDVNKTLFETYQEKLEQTTEHLNDLITVPIDASVPDEVKRVTAAAKHFCESLVAWVDSELK